MNIRFLFIVVFFLPSCTAELAHYSFYGAVDPTLNVFNNKYDMNPPTFSYPFLGKETSCNGDITLKIHPKDPERAYGLAHFMLIPYPILTKSKEDTKIRISTFIPDNTIMKDFSFSLKIRDKIYTGEINNSDVYFNATIEDVGKKGIIIVEHKGIKKEIPFKRGREWFFFMFFING